MDYAIYLAVLGLLAVLERLPLGFAFRCGGLWGLTAWALLPNYRRLARRNLRIALGSGADERAIRRLVRDHFRNLGANLLCVPRLGRMRKQDVESRVEGHGFEGLRATIDRGRGVIVAINHIGPARWRCTIEPPLEPQGKTVEELTARLNATLERQITASPKDWLWLHNRWKTMSPRFLGRKWKRGWYLPPGTDAGRLPPFRLLFPTSDRLGEAVLSIPAVEACKAGRRRPAGGDAVPGV